MVLRNPYHPGLNQMNYGSLSIYCKYQGLFKYHMINRPTLDSLANFLYISGFLPRLIRRIFQDQELIVIILVIGDHIVTPLPLTCIHEHDHMIICLTPFPPYIQLYDFITVVSDQCEYQIKSYIKFKKHRPRYHKALGLSSAQCEYQMKLNSK